MRILIVYLDIAQEVVVKFFVLLLLVGNMLMVVIVKLVLDVYLMYVQVVFVLLTQASLLWDHVLRIPTVCPCFVQLMVPVNPLVH